MPNALYSFTVQEAYPALRHLIDTFHCPDVRWLEADVDCEQSVVTFRQLYWDKSKTTTKVSGLPSHHIYTNFMYSSESM